MFNFQEIGELSKALDKLGDKLNEEEKQVILKVTTLNQILGEEGLNGQNYLSQADTLDLTMKAIELVSVNDEIEMLFSVLEMAKGVLVKQKASENYPRVRDKYLEAHLDLEIYFEAYLKLIDVMKEEIENELM